MAFCKILLETLMFAASMSAFYFALLTLLALTNDDCTMICTSLKPDNSRKLDSAV